MMFKISDLVISFILSVFINIGISFTDKKTMFVPFDIALCVRFIVAWIIILFLINIFNCILSWGIKKNKNSKKNIGNFPRHFHISVFLVLIILWLPYLIILYPGSAWYDCSSSILQIYGVRELSNWNPIIQTFLIGGFIRLGEKIHDPNLGIFLYNFLQCILASIVISYGLSSLYRIEHNKKIIFLGIVIYGLLPVYPIYITSMGKDTNWSCFLLLSIICIFNTMNDFHWIQKVKNIVLYYFALLGVCLLRNAGIYVAICFCIILIVILPRQMKYKHLIRQIILLIVILFWNNTLLPILGINIDNISRDNWNIQFQQIARYVNLYPNEVTEKEKQTINMMLSYDDVLTEYNPNIVDTITEVYYGDSISNEDKQEFVKMYWRMFRKHPLCFVDAIMAKSCGYFTPLKYESVKPFTIIGVHDIYTSIQKYMSDFKIYNVFNLDIYSQYIELLQKIPILRLITHCGFWVWALFFELGFAIKNKKREFCILAIPFFVIVLGLIVVPANNYFRYVLSLPFVLPFLILGIYGLEKIKNDEECRCSDYNSSL